MTVWNPWHGCTKVSPGCLNCYVYRHDSKYERDASIVSRTSSFDLPVRRDRKGEYMLQAVGDYVYSCFTSDFLRPEADGWRTDA